MDAAVCVALAGVTAEYLGFGSAEGGLDDVAQLLGLTGKGAESPRAGTSLLKWHDSG